jgi:hypothetical protein
MVSPTVQKTWTLFFPVLAALLIIIVVYGIVHFTTSYGFTYAPKYGKTKVVIDNSTGNIPSTPTPLNATTNTQLKTYTDPTRFFTLQYPADWTVQYKQPVTKLDVPSVMFISHQPRSAIFIGVKKSAANSPQEFRSIYNRYAYSIYSFAFGNPAIRIIGEGFGIYSIAGYDTYAVRFSDSNIENPSDPREGMALTSRIGYQEMTIMFEVPRDSFDQQWPVIQKMIDSIKITGVR